MIKVCACILNTSDGQKENIKTYEKGTEYEVISETRHLNVKDGTGKLLGTHPAFLWVERCE